MTGCPGRPAEDKKKGAPDPELQDLPDTIHPNHLQAIESFRQRPWIEIDLHLGNPNSTLRIITQA